MSSTTLATDPDTIENGSSSTLPWDIDFSAHLENGEAVSAPTATLEDLTTATTYAGGVASATATSSTIVRVVLQSLVKGHRYRLVTRCTVSATKTPGVYTIVEVPF